MGIANDPRATPVIGEITAREREILEMYIETGHIPEAAVRLGIAPTTARNHLAAMRKRVGARNTMQLVYMLATGELDIASATISGYVNPDGSGEGNWSASLAKPVQRSAQERPPFADVDDDEQDFPIAVLDLLYAHKAAFTTMLREAEVEGSWQLVRATCRAALSLSRPTREGRE